MKNILFFILLFSLKGFGQYTQIVRGAASKHYTDSIVGTAKDTTIIATSGQTTFSFPLVTSNTNNFSILLDGLECDKTYFTVVGSTIVFSRGIEAGVKVKYKRYK